MKIDNKDKITKDDYKLKYSKLKIHMIYCLIIATIFIVGLFTISGYSNNALSNQVAFAATISGAILSVLAIIITIVGEIKSENAKDKLLNISDKLDNTVVVIDRTMEKFDSSTDELNNLITSSNREIKNSINGLSSKFSSFKGTELQESSSNKSVNIELINCMKKVWDNDLFKNALLLLYYLIKKNETTRETIYINNVIADYTKVGLSTETVNRVWDFILLFQVNGIINEEFINKIETSMGNSCDIEKDRINKLFLNKLNKNN